VFHDIRDLFEGRNVDLDRIQRKADCLAELGMHELDCGCIIETTQDELKMLRLCRAARMALECFLDRELAKLYQFGTLEWWIRLDEELDEKDQFLLRHIVVHTLDDLTLQQEP